MKKEEFIARVKGGLIVSCQALENEPLHGSFIMGKMAKAAVMGGAVGIRANTPEDITQIRKEVSVPVIGLLKRTYPGNDMFITPTMEEVTQVMTAFPDVLAIDATARPRPDGKTLCDLVGQIREKYPDVLLMADISDYEEAEYAQKLEFDFVGTTLYGYTAQTKGKAVPNFDLLEQCVQKLSVPVIAEGGIKTPSQLKKAISLGACAAVIGGAITRPQNITKDFTDALLNR